MIVIKAVGIVCEYNPFHKGHLYQLREAVRLSGADASVGIMSGNFVQRGGGAVLNKWARAEAAVKNGVNLVIELPGVYSAQTAEIFACGAVMLMSASNVIDYISFGAEDADSGKIMTAAKILNREEETYKAALLKVLNQGFGYPYARSAALKEVYGIDFTETPNNILAVEYAKAILKYNADLKIFPVKRRGSDHDKTGSASYIRSLILKGEDFSEYVTPESEKIIRRELESNTMPVCGQSFERLILYRLRTMSPGELSEIADVAEGLENRIIKAAYCCSDFDSLVKYLCTKRYTAARIRRIVFNALIGITKEEVKQPPQYIKILAADKTGCELIKQMKKKADLPVITKPAEGKGNPSFEKEARADAVYAAACPDGKMKGGVGYTTSPFIEKG